MSECAFDLILEEWAESEWKALADAPEFKTSKKHDRAMKRIFKLYEKNIRDLYPRPAANFSSTRKRIMIAVLAIILATLAGCTVAYFVSQGFRGAVHKEYTDLFPINYENCPTIIEEKYYLSELPEGYEVLDSSSTPFNETIIFENTKTDQTITFYQMVKNKFNSVHYNTEKGELVEVEINGHPGLYLETWRNNQISTYLIWDNGDYILEIAGNLTKNDIMKLAKSAKVL